MNVQALGFVLDALACLHMTLRCSEVVVNGATRGGLAAVVVEQPRQLISFHRGEMRMLREILHAADQFDVTVREGQRQVGPVGVGDQVVPVVLQAVVEALSD